EHGFSASANGRPGMRARLWCWLRRALLSGQGEWPTEAEVVAVQAEAARKPLWLTLWLARRCEALPPGLAAVPTFSVAGQTDTCRAWVVEWHDARSPDRRTRSRACPAPRADGRASGARVRERETRLAKARKDSHNRGRPSSSDGL